MRSAVLARFDDVRSVDGCRSVAVAGLGKAKVIRRKKSTVNGRSFARYLSSGGGERVP